MASFKTNTDLQIKNIYDALPQQLKKTYNLFHQIRIQTPFRALIIGRSGSMKSNLCLNLLMKMNMWKKLYLFAKNIDEPLYHNLIEAWQHHEGEIVFSDSIDDLPDINSFDPDEPSVIIFDDLICESERQLRNVCPFFVRGRKHNISCVFISQKFTAIPIMIRSNSDYIFVKSITSQRQVDLLFREYDLPEDKANALYKQVIKEPTSFMLIDTLTGDDNLRMRHNFTS